MVYTLADGTQMTRRKRIPITGQSSGAQTDFQIKMAAIAYAVAMQNDFDDLRFTQADMQTLIDAWLEEKTDGVSADVWGEFPTTPANGVMEDYWMYYGNAGAANYWDIGATFIFGDDFSSNTIANYTERYYATWTQFTHKEVTGGELHIGFNAADYGSALLFHTASTLTNAGYAMRSRFRASGYYSDAILFRHQKEIGLTTDTTPTYVTPCSCAPDFSGWHSDGCIDMPDNHCQTTDISGTTTDEIIYSLDGSTYYPGFWVQDITSNAVSELWVDWALVRKYAANPPTAALGTEEHQRRTPMMI